ncbi:MAG TPA: type II toxin-antitoxin system PemK/MazF family toxin [Ktedonobacterales bacterium]
MMSTPKPNRGEVWLVRFDPSEGDEIQKIRPAVVMSIAGVGRLQLRIVVPITDWKAHYPAFSWFVPLSPTAANGLRKDSVADAFQVKSVSENRFIRRLGVLEQAQIDAIAAAIALCVGYKAP